MYKNICRDEKAANGRRTDFWKGDELAARFASFIDPVDCFLDREFEIEPAGLSLDGGGLVLLNRGRHYCRCGWTSTIYINLSKILHVVSILSLDIVDMFKLLHIWG